MWNVYVNRLLATCILMQLLMILSNTFRFIWIVIKLTSAATGLIRRKWLDSIAGVPPILLIIAFKVYLSKTSEQKFRYYEPTPVEAEAERKLSFSEKRTRHSEIEKRFLHPALQHDKLFQVMVHKSQEALAREVLSAYPWFVRKYDNAGEGVEIKAIREVRFIPFFVLGVDFFGRCHGVDEQQENLEYNPLRDGPVDDAHQAEWDARSNHSTDMLGASESEFASPAHTPIDGPYNDPYSHMPLPTTDTSDYPLAYASTANLQFDHPSTDNLVQGQSRSEDYRARRQPSRPYPSNLGRDDPVATSPLLDHTQSWDARAGDANVPYPPSAYAQPTPPIGYTPPTMRRTATGGSQDDGYGTRWDTGDVGSRERGYYGASPSGGASVHGQTSPPSYRTRGSDGGHSSSNGAVNGWRQGSQGGYGEASYQPYPYGGQSAGPQPPRRGPSGHGW